MKPMRAPNLPGYKTEQEQADRLGWSLATLRRYRRMGGGPPFIMLGRRPMYGDDTEWLAKQAPRPAEPPRRGRPRRAPE
jgi:hypothetical protein